MPTGDAYKTTYLDAAFGTGHHSGFPATYHVALYTVMPTDLGGGTEATWTGYARVAVANTDAQWDVAAGQASNLNALVFPQPDVDVPVVGWGLHSHATNDVLVHYAEYAQPVNLLANKDAEIPVGGITVTVLDEV